jgi:EmrB/QacA subfamily drug resistance transporter
LSSIRSLIAAVAALTRGRRRDPASLISEINDGIVPASDRIGPSADAAPSSARGYRRVALIVATALFMQNLDATVLSTALPTVAHEFGVPPPSLSLALTSYLIALAIFIPVSGYAADRFGGRNVFQAAIALFVVGSLACGLSVNLEMLIAARFLQGIGGAMMVPVGRLILLRSVEKRNLVSAVSWLAMPAMIGPILGPPLGGAIITFLDWRWIFWINLPMGVVGIVLVKRFIPTMAAEGASPFDAPGFVLLALALAPLLFGIELATRAEHLAPALALVAIGTLSGAIYIGRARRTSAALLDLSLLRVPTFRLSLIGGSLIRITQGAQPFLLPMMMQLAFALSAVASGAITMATAVGAFAMKGLSKPLLRRFGFRTVLTTTGVLAPLVYSVTGFFGRAWPFPAIIAVLGVGGFLMSLQFTAYNTIAYGDIDLPRMSRATSFYATFQQLSLSLGICLAATALTLVMQVQGHESPQFGDFAAAIWTVVAVSLCAVVVNLGFARDAGAELSGHRSI